MGDKMKLETSKRILIEIKELLVFFLSAILVLTFIISQNKIPSGSMIPTLNINDRILVSMIPYYYRSPQRGEMVVFNGPNGFKWIKRVVGLPGETIDIQDGKVYIDGSPLDESAYLEEQDISGLNPTLETVVSYPYTIPKGQYFLLGDNRLESYDCRYIGPIEEKDITGKAVYRVYPFDNIGALAS